MDGSDNAYIAGRTLSFGAGDYDAFLVKYEKDMPIIIINSPIDNQLFGSSAPTFDLTISGVNVETTWYTIDGGLTNYTFVGTSGTINQTAWDNLNDGQVTIRFYANNTLGMIGFQEVTVVKAISQPTPPWIPGYNILLLLGITSTIALIIVKRRLNHLN